jgi:hypothetical protein
MRRLQLEGRIGSQRQEVRRAAAKAEIFQTIVSGDMAGELFARWIDELLAHAQQFVGTELSPMVMGCGCERLHGGHLSRFARFGSPRIGDCYIAFAMAAGRLSPMLWSVNPSDSKLTRAPRGALDRQGFS